MDITPAHLKAWQLLASQARNPDHPILRLVREFEVLRQKVVNLERAPVLEAEVDTFEREDMTRVVNLLLARVGKHGPQPPLSSPSAAMENLLDVHDAAVLVLKAYCARAPLEKPMEALAEAFDPKLLGG